jgi:hypothetical protein
LDARLTTLLCKKIIVVEYKEKETGRSNSDKCEESSKEGCGSKRALYFSNDDDDDEGDVLITFSLLADLLKET